MILYQLKFKNGKCYLGITRRTLARRVREHLADYRYGDRAKGALYRAIAKYGEDAFEASCLVIGNDWDYMCALECAAIIRLNTRVPNGYNVTEGGEGIIGYQYTDEQRAAMSIRQKGIKRGPSKLRGRKIPETQRLRIIAAVTGRACSEETRRKISEANKKWKRQKGRICSEETRRRISEAQKGKVVSEETRQNIKEGLRRRREQLCLQV